MNGLARRVLFSIRSLPVYPGLQSRLKYSLVDMLLAFFGPSFEVVGRFAPEFREEIASWEDGRRFAIGILPKGPHITLEKSGDTIRYLGKGLHSPGITMMFKHLDAALPVFMGLCSSYRAFAENSVLVDGNLSHTMEVNRVVNIVNSYLFPGPFLPRILKRPPRFSMKRVIIRAKVYAGLMPTVLRHTF